MSITELIGEALGYIIIEEVTQCGIIFGLDVEI